MYYRYVDNRGTCLLAGLLSYYPYVKNQEIHILGPWKILQG